MQHRTLTLALLLSLSPLSHAQQDPPSSTPVTAAEHKAVVEQLGQQLRAKYVFPDAGTSLADALRAREAAGAYATAKDVNAFASALATDMRTLGKGRALRRGPCTRLQATSGRAGAHGAGT